MKRIWNQLLEMDAISAIGFAACGLLNAIAIALLIDYLVRRLL